MLTYQKEEISKSIHVLIELLHNIPLPSPHIHLQIQQIQSHSIPHLKNIFKYYLLLKLNHFYYNKFVSQPTGNLLLKEFSLRGNKIDKYELKFIKNIR